MSETPPNDQPTPERVGEAAAGLQASVAQLKYFQAITTMMNLNSALVTRGGLFKEHPHIAQAIAFLNGASMCRETEVMALVTVLERKNLLTSDEFFEAFCERAALIGQEIGAAVREAQARPKILIAQADIPRGGRPS